MGGWGREGYLKLGRLKAWGGIGGKDKAFHFVVSKIGSISPSVFVSKSDLGREWTTK